MIVFADIKHYFLFFTILQYSLYNILKHSIKNVNCIFLKKKFNSTNSTICVNNLSYSLSGLMFVEIQQSTNLNNSFDMSLDGGNLGAVNREPNLLSSPFTTDLNGQSSIWSEDIIDFDFIFFNSFILTFFEESCKFSSTKTFYIFLHKQLGFLKTTDNVKKTILLKASTSCTLPNLNNENFNLDDFGNELSYYSGNKKNSFNFSNFSAVNKFKLVFTKNRNIFRFFFDSKSREEFQFDKKFNGVFKTNFLNVINLLEFQLFHILLTCNFIFSYKQGVYLTNLGYLHKNSVCCDSLDISLQVGDIIQFIIAPEIFFFFDKLTVVDALIKRSLGDIIWRLNRFLFNIHKQAATHIPRWVKSFAFSENFLPSYLEIDYSLCMLIVLQLPTTFDHYNWYYFQFINVYLMRLYSWKYII
jgi:hypothetical protein